MSAALQVQMLATQMLLLQNLQAIQAQQDSLGLQAMAAYRHPLSSAGSMSMDSNTMFNGGGGMYGNSLMNSGMMSRHC